MSSSGIIVCSDKTGRAKGSLEPVFFFEREDGYVLIPTYDAGMPQQARHIFEMKFRNHPTEKWQWRETDGTLTGVRDLERRLIEQERRRTEQMKEMHHVIREASRKAVRDNLYARMVSSSTSEFDRECCRIWLEKRDDPSRDKVATEMDNHNWYLWSLEQDSGTKIEDRMPMQPGEFWRTPEQQKA